MPKDCHAWSIGKSTEISDCDGASGLTCRMQFRDGTILPSRILITQLDHQNRPIGKKFLPYPDLKPREKAWATFPTSSAETIVLTGEWKGRWRSAY